MQCIERLIVDDKKSVDVKEDAYWKHARDVDERNHQKVWSDPRAHNYYWTKHGRSATQSPFTSRESWSFLERPDFEDLNLG
jgi:4-hydroxyacetophenone monooxygenase